MKTIQLTDAQIYHLRHAIEYYKTGQDDLLEQIFEFSGFPVENMTYKTFQKNGFKTTSYPRYDVTSWKHL